MAEIPLLNVTVVFSAQEAEHVLNKQHIHMCLLDLGICDVNNDELHLVKTFAAKTCFLMITGSGGTERAVQAIGAGALYCIDKPLVFTNVAPMIAAYIQHEIHYPRPRGNASDRFVESVRILNSKQPGSVDAWAAELGVSADALHDLLGRHGAKPGMAIFLSQMYRTAFGYWIARISGMGGDTTVLGCSVMQYVKFKERFLAGRCGFLAYLKKKL